MCRTEKCQIRTTNIMQAVQTLRILSIPVPVRSIQTASSQVPMDRNIEQVSKHLWMSCLLFNLIYS